MRREVCGRDSREGESSGGGARSSDLLVRKKNTVAASGRLESCLIKSLLKSKGVLLQLHATLSKTLKLQSEAIKG